MLGSIWASHIEDLSNSSAMSQSFFLLGAEQMRTNTVYVQNVINSDLCGIVLHEFLSDVLERITKCFFQVTLEECVQDFNHVTKVPLKATNHVLAQISDKCNLSHYL